MRKIYLAAVLAGFLAPQAQAAELLVVSPGFVYNAGIQDLAASFTKETGIKVTVKSVGMGAAITQAKTATPIPDLIVLPTEPYDLMGNFAKDDKGIIEGTWTPLGRVEIVLAVKAGVPHPDISTPEKFVAVLKGAKEVMISNWNAARPGYPYTGKYLAPGKGTLVAKVIYDMLQRPEFAGVHSTASSDGEGGESLGKGHGDMALQAVCEIINHPEISLVGVVPDQFYLHIDMAVAVGAHANDEKNAKAFVAFATGPQAAPLWKAKGINPF